MTLLNPGELVEIIKKLAKCYEIEEADMHELTEKQKERIKRTSAEIKYLDCFWEILDQENREWLEGKVNLAVRFPKEDREYIKILLGIQEKTLEEKIHEYSGRLIESVTSNTQYIASRKVAKDLAKIAEEHFKK